MREMNSGIENRWKHASGLLAAVVFYCSPILPLPAGEASHFLERKEFGWNHDGRPISATTSAGHGSVRPERVAECFPPFASAG